MKTLFLLLTFFWLSGCVPLFAGVTGWATYYTVKSCQKDGNLGTLTASGRRYDEQALTCALPAATAKALHLRYGQKLVITKIGTTLNMVVTYTDRGPGRKAQSRGVVIDLTPAAFRALGGKLKDGKIKVKVEKIKCKELKARGCCKKVWEVNEDGEKI